MTGKILRTVVVVAVVLLARASSSRLQDALDQILPHYIGSGGSRRVRRVATENRRGFPAARRCGYTFNQDGFARR
jgi:hypothetical protein